MKEANVVVVKTWCPTCGEQDLPANGIRLRTFRPYCTGRDFYEFNCPECSELIQRPADRYVVRALRTGRVPETKVNLPAEMLDTKRADTRQLTRDDILDFALQLQSTDFLIDTAGR